MVENVFGASRGRPEEWGRIYPPDADWLSGGPLEAALEPGLPIVDAHHHLFDLPGYRYLAGDFAADLAGGHRVVGTVYSECHSHYRSDGPESLRPVGETEFAAATGDEMVAGATLLCDGIVGFADLTLGARVRPVVEAHIVAAGRRFKGTRFATGWDEHKDVPNNHTATGPAMLADPAVRAGAAVLAEMGLSLDVMVFFHQLREVAALADSVPDLTIVLDHCGGPIGHGAYSADPVANFAIWENGIRNLALRPNVVCKLGGVLARGAAFDYRTAPRPLSSLDLEALWSPWFLTCIDAFGAERCMFESNFPVEKMGVDYAVLWNSFKRIAGGASVDEMSALFAGTAGRVYDLTRPQEGGNR